MTISNEKAITVSCHWASPEGENLLVWAKEHGIEALEDQRMANGYYLKTVLLNLRSLEDLWALSERFDVMVCTLKDGRRLFAIDQRGKGFRQR